MSDYISREEAITASKYGLISTIPSVDVRENIHGEWIAGNNICPKCGEDKFKGLEADIYADWQPNFCPNCGADMRKPIIDEEDIPMEYFESGGK